MTRMEIFSNVLLKVILSIAIISIAFNPRKLKELGKELMIFYLTSFTFGGVAFAMLYFVKPQNILLRNRNINRYVPYNHHINRWNSRFHHNSNSI